MEAPRPQFFEQKDTQQESIFKRHQETARNTGIARRKHRGRGGTNTTPPPGTNRGLGLCLRTTGEGSGRADGGGREREEGTPGQENLGSDRYLISQVDDSKVVATVQGKTNIGSHEELLGLPIRGVKRR